MIDSNIPPNDIPYTSNINYSQKHDIPNSLFLTEKEKKFALEEAHSKYFKSNLHNARPLRPQTSP